MSNLLEGKVFVKISELDATTTFDTNDEFVLVRNGVTVKTAGIDFVDTVVSIGNLATKSYTDAAVAALVNSAPTALDTLSELSAALNNDADFASTITNQLALKLNVGDFGLYFWNELNAITTYHVAEGANLYYTEDRVDANFATKNTDALAEGLLNLYYTDTRALEAVVPFIPTSIFDLDVPNVATPENIPGYLYYDGTDLSWKGSVINYADIGNINNEFGPTQIAIGAGAGLNSQDIGAVAIGAGAGGNEQGDHAVAIGREAGGTYQYDNAIAIGWQAGSAYQGPNSIAIGALAGINQVGESIILNATGSQLDASVAGFHVAPIRDTSATTKALFYNTTSKEITTATLNTDVVTEGTNLYHTTARVRSAIGAGTNIEYNSSTGIVGVTATPTFTTVTTTNLNVQNVTFTGTGAVTISSGNDLNLSAAGDVAINGEVLSDVAFSGAYADLTGKPTLATVATTGSYNDLTSVKKEESFSIQISNFNAVVGTRYGINTSSAAVTATLPASPTAGDAIFFADMGGVYSTNNLTIARNGNTIMGFADDLTVSTDNESFGLCWNGTTWRIY